jgi:hypothetical protein
MSSLARASLRLPPDGRVPQALRSPPCAHAHRHTPVQQSTQDYHPQASDTTRSGRLLKTCLCRKYTASAACEFPVVCITVATGTFNPYQDRA